MKGKNDTFFLKLIRDGILVVDDNNIIWQTKDFRIKNECWIDRVAPKIPCFNSRGYLVVSVWYRRAVRSPAHRVLWMWHKGSIDSSKEINHINGVRNDNRIENLELVTTKENIVHAFKTLPRKPNHGDTHLNSKLSSDMVRHIVDRLRTGESAESVSRDIGVHACTIKRIRSGQTWRRVTGIVPKRKLVEVPE